MSRGVTVLTERPAEEWETWAEKHDAIVYEHLRGLGDSDIAKRFGLSMKQVRAVLARPEALAIESAFRQQIAEKISDSVGERLIHATTRAVEVIEQTLEEDLTPGTAAKAHQDRVAIKVLEGQGFLTKDGEASRAGESLTPHDVNRLVEALTKADESKRLNNVEDADWEFEEGTGEGAGPVRSPEFPKPEKTAVEPDL